MKIGIFGGTFNPPHITHINMVTAAIEHMQLDIMYVLPNGEPPHKFCALDKDIRLEMTKLAFSGIDKVVVDDYELNASGKSYTVNTLHYFKNKHKDDDLYFVIGRDSLEKFDTWYSPQEICQLATLVVANRAGAVGLDELIRVRSGQFHTNIIGIDIEQSDISSTEIRLGYQYGFDMSKFVPPSVNKFILSHRLYSEFNAITSRLSGYLAPHRLRHTFYVTLKGLEINTNCPSDKVFVACTLHDIAKYIKPEDYSKYGFDNDDRLPEPVVHAFLGEKVARIDFGVTDAEILDAIKYHTTAKPDMSELAMIVFIADKTEKTRPYPTVHLFKPTLVETFYEVMCEAKELKLIKDATEADCPLTEQAIQYYKEILQI